MFAILISKLRFVFNTPQPGMGIFSEWFCLLWEGEKRPDGRRVSAQRFFFNGIPAVGMNRSKVSFTCFLMAWYFSSCSHLGHFPLHLICESYGTVSYFLFGIWKNVYILLINTIISNKVSFVVSFFVLLELHVAWVAIVPNALSSNHRRKNSKLKSLFFILFYLLLAFYVLPVNKWPSEIRKLINIRSNFRFFVINNQPSFSVGDIAKYLFRCKWRWVRLICSHNPCKQTRLQILGFQTKSCNAWNTNATSDWNI